jgi:hypothetical protein
MLSPEESKTALYKWFRKRYVADLDQLFRVLETNSSPSFRVIEQQEKLFWIVN